MSPRNGSSSLGQHWKYSLGQNAITLTWLALPALLFNINAARSLGAPATLSAGGYTQSFDSIGSGLPTGWSTVTGASTTTLGSSTAFTSSPTAWSNGSGGFYNFAADTVGSGATAAQQSAATNRALGMQQSGSLGDPARPTNLRWQTPQALRVSLLRQISICCK